MALNKKKNALGSIPSTLNMGIFSKTNEETPPTQESTDEEKIIKKEDSVFLIEDSEPKEKVNFRIPIALNDWLDEIVKQGKRKHGAKIPKEVWIQAALEIFQVMPVKWEDIDSIESLREKLLILYSSFLKED